MTKAVQQLLNSFDALTEAEKQAAAAEVLRRTLHEAPSELPDDALIAAAEELFLEVDAREAADGKP